MNNNKELLAADQRIQLFIFFLVSLIIFIKEYFHTLLYIYFKVCSEISR